MDTLSAISLDITTLTQAYREHTVTPRQLMESLLQKIDAENDRHIWIALRPAAEILADADRLAGMDPASLPLYGLPFAVKDNIDLAGVPTTCGCPAFSYTPSRSAFVVERLTAAGAIPIGKTNLDQFATGLVGTRSPYGACANSFDPRYIAGGSSSGSAVAVALGQVSFALGTDTAGSGRVPAAFNNLVGLKPTPGLLSCRGVVPACRTLDCVSIFALTAGDAAQVFTVAGTFDAADPYARSARFDGRSAEGGFRFGVPRANQLEFFGDRESAALFDTGIDKLVELGGEAVTIDFAPFMETAQLLYDGPWVAERYAAIREFIEHSPEALNPVTRDIIVAARDKTAVDAFEAQYRLAALKRIADGFMADLDCVLTPTAPTIYRIDEIEADPVQLNTRLGYYTNFMNLLDYCALALPAGFRKDGLPFGITVFADAEYDHYLLGLGARLQQAYGLALGATPHALPVSKTPTVAGNAADQINIVVCGAHMQGLPLNAQLTERGATLVRRTLSAPGYRLYALGGSSTGRPGMVRDESTDTAIEVEVWSMPIGKLGGFMKLIPAPLGLGTVLLADGSAECGFICEHHGLEGAIEITHLGGWRRHLAEHAKP